MKLLGLLDELRN